jgi:hypothetical protein
MAEEIDDLKGRAKEAAGDLTDDPNLKREGQIDRAGPASRRSSTRPRPRLTTPWIRSWLGCVAAGSRRYASAGGADWAVPNLSMVRRSQPVCAVRALRHDGDDLPAADRANAHPRGADYGHGDLAFAEVVQRLSLHLPEATLVLTPVPAFDTVSAGFCVGQLALTPGPVDRVVFHNVGPRADTPDPRPGNQGERLVCARMDTGVLVVGANAGYTFSFLRDEALTLREVRCSTAGSQFRSRDFLPELLARVVAGDESVLGEPIPPGAVAELPQRRLGYVDG